MSNRFENKTYCINDSISEKINDIESIMERINMIGKEYLDDGIKKKSNIKSVYASYTLDKFSDIVPKLKSRRNILDNFDFKKGELTNKAVELILAGEDIYDDKMVISRIKDLMCIYEGLDILDKYSNNDIEVIYTKLNAVHNGNNGNIYRVGDESRNTRIGEILADATYNGFVYDINEVITKYTYNDKVHPLIRAIVTNYYVEDIQPYKTDNGFMARLWHRLLLCNWDKMFLWMDIDGKILDKVEEYYKAMRTTMLSKSINTFIEFMLGIIFDAAVELYDEVFEKNINKDYLMPELMIKDVIIKDSLIGEIDNVDEKQYKVESKRDIDVAYDDVEVHIIESYDAEENELVTEISDVNIESTLDIEADVSQEVRELLDIIKDGEYSTKEMMSLVGITRRPTFRDMYLSPAIEKGMVEMTIPNSPNHPNQKYRLTEKCKRQYCMKV